MRVIHSRIIRTTGLVAALFVGMVPAAFVRAGDPEGCLSCHRYPGLAAVGEDGRSLRLFHVDPHYYDRVLGPHARLRCTDCHTGDEVRVIPHDPVPPVNCTTTCHLVGPGRTETLFSHGGIESLLEMSAHNRQTLSRSNELLGSPLSAGQSQCLLCHDEPTFRRREEPWVQHVAPVARCMRCHDETLMIDADFMYWHVHARSRPARSHEDIVRTCAVCHHNDAIHEAFGLPDTTASYLASFHGKAMQLGYETAGCLDCHVGPMQNVHLMLPSADPHSSTHEAQLPDTCRSAACHPTAGPGMGTAAVHLDLATDRGLEFFIGAVFVLLIIFTFGPSVMLQSLECVQVVLGRHDPRQHERVTRAERLMSHPRGRYALKRFTPHQRIQHWVLFLSFTLLVITGFPIKFADQAWARWTVDLLGGLPVARALHRYAGAVLIAGFAYHLAYVLITAWQRKRRTGRSWPAILLGMPMMATKEDIRYLLHLLGYLFFIRRTRPEGARFTLKEKFEYFGVFWGSALLGVTGVLMWAHAWTGTYLGGRVLTLASLLHTFEAYLALLHVGIIHMVGVIFFPTVFPLSPAMFTGDTPPEEMAEAHAAMIDEAEKQVGTEPPKGGDA